MTTPSPNPDDVTTRLPEDRLRVLADKKRHFVTAVMDMWDGEPVASAEVVAMASELLSLRRQLAERDAGIDMAMGCLDPHSENRDEALAWWRLVDTKAGLQPRSALGDPQ